MPGNTMEELTNTLKELIRTRTELKLNVDDNMLWDTAVRIFNAKNFNSQDKDKRQISDKMAYYLEKRGIDATGMSFEEASAKISEFKAKEGKK